MEQPGGGKNQVQIEKAASRGGQDVQSPSAGGVPYAPRARRFSLQVPLRYREPGESRWHCGETENISSSGMLFTGERFFALKALIEVSLRMPAATSAAAAEILCKCRIVRAARERDAEHPPKLAARILQYRQVRP